MALSCHPSKPRHHAHFCLKPWHWSLWTSTHLLLLFVFFLFNISRNYTCRSQCLCTENNQVQESHWRYLCFTSTHCAYRVNTWELYLFTIRTGVVMLFDLPRRYLFRTKIKDYRKPANNVTIKRVFAKQEIFWSSVSLGFTELLAVQISDCQLWVSIMVNPQAH